MDEEIELTIFGTMSLGDIIDKLKKASPDVFVYFDFCRLIPSHLDSYRGWYSHLAIAFTEHEYISCEKFLNLLESAVGATFTGWKGGSNRMDRDTPVWVDKPGNSTCTAIIDIEDNKYEIIIHTKRGEI